MIPNPFFYGNPVPPDQFINRRRELRRIVSLIISQGQSTAIVGEPRSGKTSLLLYLAAPETRTELYGKNGERLLFSYLDAQISHQFNRAQFWEYALRPLHQEIIAPDSNSPLAQTYQICQKNGFDNVGLERLLVQVRQANWRLMLVLDEFDALLDHPILNSAELFAGLRSLASRSQGLVLVTASRQSLTSLNKATQQLSGKSSPYFNFLNEITLGPWPEEATVELLDRAGDHFTHYDRCFIEEVAGGHPYLLQAAAYELWEIYTEEGTSDSVGKRQRAAHILYDKVELILSDTWQIWSPATQRALTAVALAHTPKLLNQREFYVKRLLHDIRDFGSELRSLEKRGFVSKDKAIPGGWRVRPSAFLWWLSDELARTVRDEPSLKEWLQAQEWEDLLTHDEKEQLKKVVRTATDMLKDGVAELIKAAAKGVVGG